MGELNELENLIQTIRGRVDRLNDFRAEVYPFEIDEDVCKAQNDLRRLDKKLSKKLQNIEKAALASL